MSNLTPEQARLKSAYLTTMPPSSQSQDLPPQWFLLLKHSPPMFAASLHLHSIPLKRFALSPKHQSLISLAIASAATHLHLPRIQHHTRAALSAGASVAEIVEVLCLTSTLGIHACNIGVPLLVEVMREEGVDVGGEGVSGMAGMSERQVQLKEEFEQKRGYWHSFWEDFLRLDPDFFGAYLEFSSVPWTTDIIGSDSSPEAKGVLDPVMKELVYVAFDAAATHLYKPGLKLHMQNVIRLGGSPDMIMEVLELATLLSTATLEVGLGVLEGELDAREKEGEGEGK